MIQCPKCGATLPDWAKQCQFCQTDTSALSKSVPPSGDPRPNRNFGERPAWIVPLYYFLSSLYIIEGLVPLVAGILLMTKEQNSGFGLFGLLPIVVGVISIIVGIGLILKVEVIRGIANIFSWVAIAVNVLDLYSSLMWLVSGHGSAIAMVAEHLIAIVTAGAMIYVIAETDTHPF